MPLQRVGLRRGRRFRAVVESLLVLRARETGGTRTEREDLSQYAVNVVVELIVAPHSILGELHDLRSGPVVGLEQCNGDEAARKDHKRKNKQPEPTERAAWNTSTAQEAHLLPVSRTASRADTPGA